MTPPLAPRTCPRCNERPVTRGHGARYCDPCRNIDPHRHGARNYPQMLVMVDCEGHQDDTGMHLLTMSYGREDGSAGSIVTEDAAKALHWLIEHVSGTWEGHRQIATAYHFNWDTAVLTKDFHPAGMELVHRANARETGLICNTDHPQPSPPERRDKRLREEWYLSAHANYIAAEAACNGYLLSRAGLDAGIDPWPALWRGPLERAWKYASEELRAYWDTNPRITVTEYMAQAADAERNAHDEWLDEDGQPPGTDDVEVTDPDEGWGEPPCGKPYHRWDHRDITSVITDGGEGDVLAWDRESQLAIATTPRRRFYVEHRPNGDLYDGWKAVDIHDVGTAIPAGSGSFEDVIDTWKPELDPEWRDVIAEGKAARAGGFDGWDTTKVCYYSEVECVAGARVGRMLLNMIATVAGVAIKPSHLFGSGSVAGELNRFYEVTTRKQTHACEDVDDLPWLTYFGGLIETPVVGRIHGEVQEDDFCSAYPSITCKLPCMRAGHGRWQQGNATAAPPGAIGHAKAFWDLDFDCGSTPPFVIRLKDGRVLSSRSGYGVWVTLAEFQAAQRRFGHEIGAMDGWWWVQECDCPPPFAWMVPFYEQRNAIKQQMKQLPKGSPEWQSLNIRQETLKLILNSAYGKLAQRRPTLGKYTNLHYASHITGATRAMMRERTWALEDAGFTVVYQHTDGIRYLGDPTLLPHGSALGEVKAETPAVDLLIAQPGLVAAREGKGACRGVHMTEFKAGALAWEAANDLTTPPVAWGKMELTDRRMYSRRLAIHENHPERAGSFYVKTLTVSMTSLKRDFAQAEHVPFQPEAWRVPPRRYVPSELIATLDDVMAYQRRLERRVRRGDFDTS